MAIWGCPCNSLSKFEVWIWTHRELIIKYLKARAADEKKEADELAANVGGLKDEH